MRGEEEKSKAGRRSEETESLQKEAQEIIWTKFLMIWIWATF
jgi:hypothetical protein